MAANNGPISVSQPSTSLVGASSSEVTFSTRYPFEKLDSTNDVSFQMITISFINAEPPDPTAPGTSTSTLVYSFAHGYNYVPSTWFMMSLDNFSNIQPGNEWGFWIIGNPSALNSATVKLRIEVDSTNVNFYIDKTLTSFGSYTNPPLTSILGYFLTIRAYVFVNDLTGTDVPSHA